VTDVCDFIDAALQYEGDWYRADAERERLVSTLRFYGASVGAVRGTVRDALRKYPGMAHNEITALSSELWTAAVFERQLAAIVLLQTHVRLLEASDLTRIEGFVRTATLTQLVDPLARDVVWPLLANLEGLARERAETVINRWSTEPDPWLRSAAETVKRTAEQPAKTRGKSGRRTGE
jgi:hypothetical protein